MACSRNCAPPRAEVYSGVAVGAGVTITHLFETCIHNDSVTGGFAFAQATGAAYHVNADEDVAFGRVPVRDGDVVAVGDRLHVAVIATPGHTFTHLAYELREHASDAARPGASGGRRGGARPGRRRGPGPRGRAGRRSCRVKPDGRRRCVRSVRRRGQRADRGPRCGGGSRRLGRP